MMKKFYLLIYMVLAALFLQGQTIMLDSVDFSQGKTVMGALQVRASATGFDTTMITSQELSALLWAANGINRPESGKRTAASAVNAQDIDLYVCLKQGIYRYNHKNHSLEPVVSGDHRGLIASRQAWTADAPVFVIMVSDISRFNHGNDSTKLIRAAMDAGIVSQNISLYCAAVGLETRIRAVMETQNLHTLMGLKPSQHLMLNNPVGYRKKD
ncbi:MAG: SagB/ThcOx family dehydrogenase [Bacteroidales bacterium]